MAAHSDSTMALGEVLVHVRIPLLVLRIGVCLFLPGWSQVGHCQHHGPPEVVIPLRHNSGMQLPGWVSYSLHFGGQRRIVHMQVKRFLLSRHLPVFTYTAQGALVGDQLFVQNDCYYHGYVEGDADSLVVLSTCFGGFQGILHTNDMAYAIEPKRLSTTFEHLIYKMDGEEAQSPPTRCGLTDEEIARQLEIQESSDSTLTQSGYEGWWTHRRFLELAVVVDNNRYVHSMSNISVVQKEVYLVVNYIGSYLSSLDIDVVLMGIEVWTDRNPIPVDNMGSLLSGFCRWKKGSFNTRLPHDIAHVFVKADYKDQVGLAYVGTVCNLNYNCGVASFMNDDFYDFAFIVSHEIGHNLGMRHDDKTCKCGRKTCVMFPYKSSTTRFSNCSYSSLWSTIAKTTCLHSPPNLENIFTLAHCGNSVVEDGEECDCGPLQQCTKDPCCQSNCTLMPGATCAFGRCCKDCQILPSGSVCRGQVNECDLPEWCNGTSHQCPEDVHVQDGVPCMDAGLCYGRRCNNRDEQCRRIFGREAKSASEICYAALNTRGDRFGHCGFRGSGYVPCKTSDVLCGRVQCADVARIPLLRDHSTVHSTRVNGFTCWGADYHFGMTTPDAGDVKDGTECGAGHICLQRRCVPMSVPAHSCSPETCHMRGVCNNRGHCHCKRGWDPPDCLERGRGGSVDSGPPPPILEKNLPWQNYILKFVWIPFFALLLGGLFCFL
nr:disintegrin and metalloproteinase domain-containing protein 20-like [Manis javanica]